MKLIDFNAAAEMLSCDTKTIQKLCDKGELTLIPVPSGPRRSMLRIDADEIKRKAAEWSRGSVAKKPSTPHRRQKEIPGRHLRRVV